jgi:hypothetical protein
MKNQINDENDLKKVRNLYKITKIKNQILIYKISKKKFFVTTQTAKKFK